METQRSRNRKGAKRRRAQGNEQNRDAKKSKSEPPGSSFLEKMKARLSGGHFRMINEKLYTCTGEEALDYFKEDPSLFNVVRCSSFQ
ncbi:ribosomal RNA-processing protein 8 [Eucalyptus grandis]|uniref:ribosomal RNA-processing protein 8 n=1 Tax=Eucalyptus grandis TaxID=71139 RepID=UPI00192F075E|nr:ribosomal RNA-processing protein 8 [Eucalyptus grandis]